MQNIPGFAKLGADHEPMMLAGSSISNLRPPITSRGDARIKLLSQYLNAEDDFVGRILEA